MANEIVTEIVLELDKFRQDLKDAQNESRDAGEKSGKSLGDGIESGLSKGGGALVKVALGVAAAVASAFAVHKLIDIGVEASENVRRLNFALQATGQYTPELSKSMQEYAESLKLVSGYDDDLIMKGETLLLSMTKLRGEGLKKATEAAVDLAAGMNIDLGSAFQLVERAANGHITQLQRMGFDLKETGDKAMDYAQALNAISIFQGAAEAKATTFGGAMQRLSMQSEDMVKTVGKAITNSPVMTGIVNLIAESKEKTLAALKTFFESGDKIGDFVLKILDISIALLDYVAPAFNYLYNGGKIVFETLVGAANLLLGGILRVGQGMAWVAAQFTDSGKAALETINTMIAANDLVIQESMAKTDSAVNNFFNTSGSDAAKEFGRRLKEAVVQAAEDAKGASKEATEATDAMLDGIDFAGIWSQMRQFENKIKITTSSIAQSMNQNIVKGFSDAGAAIGGALVKGENAFEAFGKSVLKSLGSILINFGSMLIAVGIGLSTVPMLFGLQGPAAIAAGLAATMLGGALMALAGGGGSNAPSASGGGGVASGEGTGLSASGSSTEQAQIEQRPITQVHLNVMGNVLDRKETGLELLNILNENFQNSGGILATGGV